MNSIEELKQQLILQKKAIEQKGGTVIVKGTNPSPVEITAGISTIPTSTSANISNFSLNNQSQITTSEQELYQHCEQEELSKMLNQEEANQKIQADTEQSINQDQSTQTDENKSTNQSESQPELNQQTVETDQLEGQINLFN